MAAHKRAKQSKMFKNEVLNFDLNLEVNIINLLNSLKNDTYLVGKYNSFKVYEPKERIIQSLPYKDRVVHQWYVEEFIKPYILPRFIHDTYACLPGKGTHSAACAIQKMMIEYKKINPDYYVLKCDIKKFFNIICQYYECKSCAIINEIIFYSKAILKNVLLIYSGLIL